MECPTKLSRGLALSLAAASAAAVAAQRGRRPPPRTGQPSASRCSIAAAVSVANRAPISSRLDVDVRPWFAEDTTVCALGATAERCARIRRRS